MWTKIKKFYNKTSLIIIAAALVGFFVFSILTLISQLLKGNLDPITIISLVAVIFSFPGMVNAIADEFNPKKATFKLSSRCPKCKYLIEMDMKEE